MTAKPWGHTVLLTPGEFVGVLLPEVAGVDRWLAEAAQLALERAIRGASPAESMRQFKFNEILWPPHPELRWPHPLGK